MFTFAVFTFALSSTGWALVGALGGALLGSIVGAVVTALLAAYLAHRRTSSLAKAGARLLQGDFAIAGKQIESALKDGRWYGYMRWHDGNWERYRGVLVERLDGDEFDSVAQAARGLKEIFDGMPNGPGWPEGRGWMRLAEGSDESFGAVTNEVVTAYNVLCRSPRRAEDHRRRSAARVKLNRCGGRLAMWLPHATPRPWPPPSKLSLIWLRAPDSLSEARWFESSRSSGSHDGRITV